MFKLASLFVEIGADAKPLDNTLAGAKSKVIAAATAMKASFTKAFSIESIGIGIGAAIPGMVASIGGRLVDAAKSGVFAASDLNETIQKTEVVFGAASKGVISFAESMRDSFGSSRKEILDSASGFGLIAKGAGLSKVAAAELSVKLAGLADDASSFYNVGMDVALEKIRAGLTGESEPLRAFGVLLNEDAVKAEALRMGLVGVGKVLSESSKVAARASLIQKGLADAEGDHMRTAGGFANQTRELSGRLEDLGATVGNMALPAITSLTVLTNNYIKAQAGAIEGLKEWGGAIARFAGKRPADTSKEDALTAKKEAAQEKARKAMEAEREPGAVRAAKAKAIALAELEKPADEAALTEARAAAYKTKATGDRQKLRDRIAERGGGVGMFGRSLSDALKGTTAEEEKVRREAYDHEAERELKGLERYKSIIKEKIGLTLGLHEAIKKGGAATLGALAERFLNGKDPKASVLAAQAALDLKTKDERDERKRNFVTQTFTSAQEQNRAIETMTSTFSKKAALPADELREIKKNSDAQVNHLKTCAESLKALVGSSIPAVFAP